MRRLALLLLLAVACQPKPAPPGGGGTDTTVTPPADSTSIDTAVVDTLLPADTLPEIDSTEPPVITDTSELPPPDTVLMRVDSTLTPNLFAAAPTVKVNGIGFGGYAAKPCGNYSGGFIGVTPGSITRVIDCLRAAGRKACITMTGGKHDDFKSGGKFSMAKWEAAQKLYNTPAIQAAVAKGVKDGTLLCGNSVMDEPMNTSPDNSWGPKGTVTKAMVDHMCGVVKAQHPTLPAGVVHDYDDFEPTVNYRVCDFLLIQYRNNKAKIDDFIRAGNAFGKRSHVAIVYSMNVLDGGDKVPGCPMPRTGGKGVSSGASGQNCQMTPSDIRTNGRKLMAATCGVMVYWRWDKSKQQSADYRAAYQDVADYAKTLPAKSCRRAA